VPVLFLTQPVPRRAQCRPSSGTECHCASTLPNTAADVGNTDFLGLGLNEGKVMES
jgi:hypothetical protein